MAKNKTTAAQRRKRLALSVPDVWVTHPPYRGQLLALRLQRGRKVLQRTLTQEEADFLVWQLGWSLHTKGCGSSDAKEALLQAFERCRTQGL